MYWVTVLLVVELCNIKTNTSIDTVAMNNSQTDIAYDKLSLDIDYKLKLSSFADWKVNRKETVNRILSVKPIQLSYQEKISKKSTIVLTGTALSKCNWEEVNVSCLSKY